MTATNPPNTLLKLGLAIAKYRVTDVIGEEALKIIETTVTDIGGETVQATIDSIFASEVGQRELLKAANAADQYFRDKCKNEDLRQLFTMGYGDLPSVQKAIVSLPEALDNETLRESLFKAFRDDAPKRISDKKINEGVTLYIECLQSALLPVEKFGQRIIYNTLKEVGKDVKEIKGDVKSLLQQANSSRQPKNYAISAEERDDISNVAKAIFSNSPRIIKYLQMLIETTTSQIQKRVQAFINIKSKPSDEIKIRFVLPPPVDAHRKDDEKSAGVVFENITDAYNFSNGQFLLLGDAGAGKTITLLNMARIAATERLADATKPLPVLANISSWEVDQTFEKWINSCVSGIDIQSKGNLYLLDGLDELAIVKPRNLDDPEGEKCYPRREFFNLATKHLQNNNLIITSRVFDFEDLHVSLSGLEKVLLQPLSENQIQSFLSTLKQNNLFCLFEKDRQWFQLVKSPLMLSIISFLFSDETGEISEGFSEINENQIIKRFVEKRYLYEKYKYDALPFTEEETRIYLEALAKLMFGEHSFYDGAVPMQAVSYDEYFDKLHLFRYPSKQLPHLDRRNVLSFISAIDKREREGMEFVNFAEKLRLIEVNLEQGYVQFTHSKIRDYFIFNAYIKEIEADPYLGVVTLGFLGNPSAVPHLIKVLERKDVAAEDKIYAAKAIARIGMPSVPYLESDLRTAKNLDDLIKIILLHDINYIVAKILRTGLSIDKSSLLKIIHDHKNPLRKVAIALLCGDTSYSPTVLATLKKALKDDDEWVRTIASWFFAALRGL